MKRTLMMIGMILLLPWSAGAAANDDPAAVVKRAVDGIIAVLKARPHPDRLTEADRAAIRRAVADYFDFRQMAKLSLGRNWKKLDDAQRDAFVETFRELLERSYGNRLAQYRNQTVRFGEVKVRKGRAVVDSLVVSPERTIPVRYRLYRSKQGWRVYDIKIEGVSMVGTFRADFKNIVKKKGVDGLLQTLADKLRRLKEEARPHG